MIFLLLVTIITIKLQIRKGVTTPMATTIKDIANRLGVSISTVSKGLNGASDISEDLRQFVLDTAIEMGYQTKKMKKAENKRNMSV